MNALPAGWGFAKPKPRTVPEIAAAVRAVPHLAHGIKPADLVQKFGCTYSVAHHAIERAKAA